MEATLMYATDDKSNVIRGVVLQDVFSTAYVIVVVGGGGCGSSSSNR
jgi:hypothetical protein